MPRKIALRRIAIVLLSLISVSLLAWRLYPLTQTSNSPGILTLKAPPFISVAKAADNTVASTMKDDPGISAYFQSPSPIDLSLAKGTFRTIELETADFIVGSVPIPGYDESEDVHVYIQTSGWVMAYYLKADPASKIFDWEGYKTTGPTVIPTKLESALTVMATQIGVSTAGTTFYDFRYPNATQLMLIAKQDGDSFQVKLPSDYTYFERSWSCTGPLYLDNNYLDSSTYKTLTPAQLVADQFHTVGINASGGGLALIYRVP